MADLNDALLNMEEGLITGLRAFKEASRLATQFIKESTRAHYNLAGQATFPIEQEITQTRPPSPKDLNTVGQVGLGITGVLPITWIASVTIIPLIGNSLQSLIQAFVTCFDIPDGRKLDLPNVLGLNKELHRNPLRKIYGLPGLLLGGLTGGLLTIVTNTINTGTRLFQTMSNGVLATEDEFPITYYKHQDTRHWAKKYLLGFPGLILGGLTGLVSVTIICFVRTITNSIESMVRVALRIGKLGLHPEEKFELKEDKRTRVQKYIFGLPGIIFGALSGGLLFGLVGMGRFITNNAKTFGRTFSDIANIALHKKNRLPFHGLSKKDGRHWIRKYIIGFPGLILGGISGLLSLPIIAVGRTITNTAKTMFRTVVTLTNLVLDKEDRRKFNGIEVKEKRPFFFKYVLGFPGLILGGITGLLSMGLVGFGRILTNSAKTLVRTFVSFTKRALHEDDRQRLKIDGLEQNEKRHWFFKYVMGSPGLLLGAITGSLSAAVVGTSRLFSNSAKTFTRTFVSICNLVLHPENRIPANGLEQNDEKRHFLRRYLLGFPGLLLGGIAGSLSAIGIILGRVVTNSAKTFRKYFVLGCNISLHEKDQRGTDFIKNDKRKVFQKYVLGFPGLVLGSIVGTIAIGTIAAGRVVTNSADSCAATWVTLSNLALHTDDKIPLEGIRQDQRSSIRKYLVGLPGLVLGAIAGGFSIALIGFGRVLTNNYKTAERVFVSLNNLVLDRKDAIPLNGLEQNEKRSIFRKYVLSFPGLVLGGIIGGVSAILVGFGRIVSQTAKSWAALSGSFMNGGIEKPYFKGLLGDQRPGKQKIMGSAGYILAVCTTLPAAMLTYVTRKIPAVLSIGLGLIISPLVLACKSISKAYKRSHQKVRFPAGTQEDEVIQRFKNIYSALDGFGKLLAGAQVPVNATGEKSWASFARKCVTFNAKSVTERALDEIIASYKISNTILENSDGFFNNSQQFKTAVEKVKSHYSDDCFASKEDIKQAHVEIDEVAVFVMNYMQAREENPPQVPKDFYTKHQKTWSAAFWGTPPAGRTEVEASLDPVVSNKVNVI